MKVACIVCARPTANLNRRCDQHPLGDRPERGNVGKAVRTAVLERDGYECRLRLPGCTGYATTVNHKRRHRDGGAFTEANLEAACQHCNSSEMPR